VVVPSALLRRKLLDEFLAGFDDDDLDVLPVLGYRTAALPLGGVGLVCMVST
jgi:hypothetical protein